jgi:long-subunit acyl-CoA synthetase (AMP-forming)
MTESGMIACNPLPPGEPKPRSAGVATSIDIKILDHTNQELGFNIEGEIVVRGACVVSRYEDDSRVNEESFRNGWFSTGDRGSIDADGYLFITGRLKDIIQSRMNCSVKK